jgi:hypothetical protein
MGPVENVRKLLNENLAEYRSVVGMVDGLSCTLNWVAGGGFGELEKVMGWI